jgi:isoleucyl-tRNA synthetase
MAAKEREDKSPLAQKEEEILAYWKESNIFQKTLEKPSPKGEFVFYEGPPTANGLPGLHHLEARAFKDAIPRFKTMQGYHVRRKGGWDTHGLPVEIEVEKELNLKSKREIEKYGIAAFNKKCKENVWKYVDEWNRFTERIGFWVDLNNPYITYKPGYIEKVWGILKEVNRKKLLYKDYKVVPWCPRCGTALSSHELAQGYEDVTEISLYVKFRLTNNEYILAWTTTPWTLLGNVALAVGEDIEYVKADVEGEHVWLAKDRLIHIAPHAKVLEKVAGKALLGLAYEPLFPFLSEKLKVQNSQLEALGNSFKIYAADFVSTEEGSGIVHTAVMYGQDDFELGTKENLPKYHLVDEAGHFTKDAGEFSGMFVRDENTTVTIIKDLAKRNLILKKEKYEHSYPFCWRCKTALIYYARDSWYIRMSALRKELLKENEKINWIPEHIKKGRFGEWLSEVKDWAISRERYWGTPLPVWVSEGGEEKVLVGSISELKDKIGRKNRFYVLRHGEAQKNVENIVSSDNTVPSSVTEKGREEIKKSLKEIANNKIDLIFSSPLIRAKETAEIVAKELGINPREIIFDERIKETQTGEFNGRPSTDYHSFFSSLEEKFTKRPKGGETLTELRQRVGEFLYEIDAKYKEKKILIVSHEYPIWLALSVAEGTDREGAIAYKNTHGDDTIGTGEIKELDFISLPHNDLYELDLHKPYIDTVEIKSEKGTLLKRSPEVIDVWFDSGSMPFAQDENFLEKKDLLYPAEYVSEAIDQTRGWFYTLHAIGILMGKGHAYKNVICLGHILDKDGRKMSKSVGNVINPSETIAKYGADPLRFWMYSVNQPGESKNFDERTVDEVVKKVFNLYLNSVAFYELYANKNAKTSARRHILDRWILSLTNKLVVEVTKHLESYKVFEAARAVREFIADLSQWYVRRSRERFKSEPTEVSEASGTLREVLLTLSELMAPFAPFAAEDVFRRLDGEGESVHLRSWPKGGDVDEKIISDMAIVRQIASAALEARAREGIKVRQPLGKLILKNEKLKHLGELLELIEDEVNVEVIIFDPKQEDEVVIDTVITEKLKEKGDVRELVRAIQGARKDKGFEPNMIVSGSLSVTASRIQLVKNNLEEIKKATKLGRVTIENLPSDSDVWFKVSLE